jgi:PIN domain nuclease of toxin-antitoxin system
VTIVDASAVLGLLFGEARANPVVGYLSDAGISTANLSEVIGKLAGVGMPPAMATELIHRLNLHIVDFGEEHATIAGGLKPATSHLGLSLGDRACLATGLVAGDRVVTLDRAWSEVHLDVPVVVLT